MNTLERINTILLHLHLPAVHAADLQLKPSRLDADNNVIGSRSDTPVHDLLDIIDRHVGIITRRRCDGAKTTVGNRLARLERHVQARVHPPYFYLGAEANNLALTG